MSRLFLQFALRADVAGLAVGIAAPAIGSFLVQRRLSLLGEGMGHLAFAGVALGVAVGLLPVWGALIAAVLGGVALEWLHARRRLSSDLSLALIFYFGLALGFVVLSAVGRIDASTLGFLTGDILTTTWADLGVIVVLCIGVLAVVAVFYKELLAVALDEETARASGLPVERLNVLLLVLTALLVAAGMRVVGLLLVAALLVLPVAAGSRLAHSFRGSMLWGMAFGALSAVVGLSIAIGQGDLAPGGTIVITSVGLFAVAAGVGRRAARRHPRGAGA